MYCTLLTLYCTLLTLYCTVLWFARYTGGIFSQRKRHPSINHEISVVGWGKDQVRGGRW